MKIKIIFVILLCLSLISIVQADVYVGTCEGYVYNTEGEFVPNAYVSTSVDVCVAGCTQETITDSGGYYVTANLNLPKQASITSYAEKNTPLGLEYGYATGISNDYQAAEVDVVICLPPPTPILIDEPNTHDTFATLEWTSFADLKSYSVYDEFQLDSQPTIISNGYGSKTRDISNLEFSAHVWKIRTCNPFCCSQWVQDSFIVGNQPPSPPILTDQPDTAPEIVNLEWISGIDPDNDETYDEYCFGITNEEETCTQDKISPQQEDALGCNYYKWKVRTCEIESQHLCSSWAEDGFIACGIDCPDCSCSPGRGGSCKTRAQQPYSLVIISPPGIEKETEFPLKISFSASEGVRNIKFKANSSAFDFNDFMISKMNNSKAKFEMIGKPKPEIKIGDYEIMLDVFIGNGKIFSETFNIKVKTPLLIRIKDFATEFPKKNKLWLVILIIIIFVLAIVIFLRIEEENKLSKFFSKRKHSTLKKPRT